MIVFLSHSHKAAVMSVKWNRNGNWLLTGSRDHLIKVYDIRAMKEMYTLKAHKKDVNGVCVRVCMRVCVHACVRVFIQFLFLIAVLTFSFCLIAVHTVLAWHPVHETLFASGGSDGAILFWDVG